MEISNNLRQLIETKINEEIKSISALTYNREKVLISIRTDKHFYEFKTDFFETSLKLLNKTLIVKEEKEEKTTKSGYRYIKTIYTDENGTKKNSVKMLEA